MACDARSQTPDRNQPSNSVWRNWATNPFRKPKLDIPRVDPKDKLIEEQQQEIDDLRGVVATLEAEAGERTARERTVAENEAWDKAGDIAVLRRRTQDAEQEAEDERKAAQAMREQNHELQRRLRQAEVEREPSPTADPASGDLQHENVRLRERVVALEAENRALQVDNARLLRSATPKRRGRPRKTDPNTIAVDLDAVARKPPPQLGSRCSVEANVNRHGREKAGEARAPFE
jgi:hypothetical protein